MSTKDLSVREKMILVDNLERQIDEFLTKVVVEYTAISKCFAASYFVRIEPDSSKYVVVDNNYSTAIKRPRSTFEILIANLAADIDYRITVPVSVLDTTDNFARKAMIALWVEQQDNAAFGLTEPEKYTFEDTIEDELKK